MRDNVSVHTGPKESEAKPHFHSTFDFQLHDPDEVTPTKRFAVSAYLRTKCFAVSAYIQTKRFAVSINLQTKSFAVSAYLQSKHFAVSHISTHAEFTTVPPQSSQQYPRRVNNSTPVESGIKDDR